MLQFLEFSSSNYKPNIHSSQNGGKRSYIKFLRDYYTRKTSIFKSIVDSLMKNFFGHTMIIYVYILIFKEKIFFYTRYMIHDTTFYNKINDAF